MTHPRFWSTLLVSISACSVAATAATNFHKNRHTTAAASPTTAFDEAFFPSKRPTTANTRLYGIAASSRSIAGGAVTVATVVLPSPATVDTVVRLHSTDARSASVPASVVVPVGKTTAAFEIRTHAVTDDSRAVLIATVGNVSKSCLVRVAKSAPPEREYVLTTLKDGAVLSGDVTAWAETNSTGIQYGDVYFSIDGQGGETGNLGSLSGSHLAYGRDFSINTEGYHNGPHTVSLYGDSGEADRRIVTFQNAISHINCDSDLNAGSVSRIRATLPSPENWTVTIRDEQGRTIRKRAGHLAAIDTSWDAKNDSGAFVPRGDYTFVISAGSHESLPRTIEFY